MLLQLSEFSPLSPPPPIAPLFPFPYLTASAAITFKISKQFLGVSGWNPTKLNSLLLPLQITFLSPPQHLRSVLSA